MNTTTFDLTPKARQRKPRTANKSRGGGCRVKCAGGNACVSVNTIDHELHICNQRECICKTILRQSGTGVTR